MTDGSATTDMPGNRNRQLFWQLRQRAGLQRRVAVIVIAGVLALVVLWMAASRVPRVALGPARVKPQIALGANGGALLAWDGSLWAWGHGTRPHRLGVETDWKVIALGGLDLVALKTNGTLWEWAGAAGLGSTAPSRLSPAANWRMVAANDVDFSALQDNGTLWIWTAGQIPVPLDDPWIMRARATTPQRKLVPLVSATNWVSVASGSLSMAAVRGDGTLWQWGRGLPPVMLTQPAQCGDETNWSAVHDAGSETVLARKRDGSWWTGGPLIHGMGPFGGLLGKEPPTGLAQVEEVADWTSVAVGRGCALGLRSDGTLEAFGANLTGILGSPRGYVRKGLLQIGRRHDWVAIGAGGEAAAGLTADGTLWVWGRRLDDVAPPSPWMQLAASWFGLPGLQIERRMITTEPPDVRRPDHNVHTIKEEQVIFSLSPAPILRFTVSVKGVNAGGG